MIQKISRRGPVEVKPDIETLAKIKVVGIGGGGNAAVNRMISSNLQGVEFVSINSDAQALHQSDAPHKLHIGKTTTRGLGAGMDPELGRKAAEEAQDEIHDLLKGSDMVFLTYGLGGGTGTGATPIIAEVARDVGALTVAVVTKPFAFEGAQRAAIADAGHEDIADKVDTIITIPNDRLLQIIDKKTSLLDAFSVVDDVLRQGVQGISELITIPGLINVDFADVKAIMENTGSALMGIGQASGENRAVNAAKAAIDSPLLELSIEGAKGILFTITGGPDLGMHEVNEAARVITGAADGNAKVIFGSVIDDALEGEVKVTVIATGFGKGAAPSRTAKKIIAPKVTPFEEPEPAAMVSEQVEVPMPEPVTTAPPEPLPKVEVSEEPTKEEEDLEIPAFIRKKMM
ncbi:cell division protein FtsZ [Patescibacteria group bacterium]